MIFLNSRTQYLMLAGLAAACLELWAGAAEAQQKKPPLPFAEHAFLQRAVRISARQKPLAELVENLAAAAGISIVTDGLPDKVAANVEVAGSVREALDQITAAFDCGWSVNRSGIVMLARRFTDPAEHPQIHVNEMRQMVRDIHSAFQLVPPEILRSEFDPLLQKLFHSLTEEQVAASRNGQLTGAGLNPEQFAWLNAATLNHEVYLAMPVCDDIAQIMVGMPKSYLQLKQRAVPIPNLDPTSPFSNQARFPSFDYLYIVRGNTGKLITHTIHLMNAN